jgi:hypothetical protein
MRLAQEILRRGLPLPDAGNYPFAAFTEREFVEPPD